MAVSSCERLRTALLRALSPTGLLTAIIASLGKSFAGDIIFPLDLMLSRRRRGSDVIETGIKKKGSS
jgi:hypothetical protein